jgi:hypothetical protein
MALHGWNAFADIVVGLGGVPRKPQTASKTRWAGFLPMLAWVNEFKHALIEYKQPANCVANDDGTEFASHEIVGDDQWVQVSQLVSAKVFDGLPCRRQGINMCCRMPSFGRLGLLSTLWRQQR